MKTQKHTTAYLAVMLGLCLIFGYLETLIPLNLGFPGAKIGICNLLVFLLLKRNGLKVALCINILRILIINILFTGVFSLIYALPAGIIATIIMYLLIKWGIFGALGISAAGGALHNLTQTAVAAVVLGTPSIFTALAPYLLILGMAAGIVCGFLAELVDSRLKKAKI